MEREKKSKLNFDALALTVSSGVMLGGGVYEMIIRNNPSVDAKGMLTMAAILATIGYGKAKASKK
jgi:hypothetical protein